MFTPRLTRPTAGNKYYIRKANGGYSSAIAGKVRSTGKPDSQCNVLANCVGYAYGRFNEIGGYGSCKYLSPVNAENFIEYAKGLSIGTTPKLGAVMVWQKGATLKEADGAGHVCVVEQIFADGSIMTSHSGWNSTIFWTEILKKGDGNWRASWMGSTYKFRGFIYNPAVTEEEENVITLKNGSKGNAVKKLQEQLNKLGFTLDVDGSFGPATQAAVKSYQTKKKLTVDGIVGVATQLTINADLKELAKKPQVLTYGTKSEDVKTLQLNLNQLGYALAVDGSFGPATLAAVKDFQSKKGLQVDGIVGEYTKNALNIAIEERAKRNAAIRDLKLTVDGKAETCWSVIIDGQDYIRLIDLRDIGLAKSVTTGTKPEVKTK